MTAQTQTDEKPRIENWEAVRDELEKHTDMLPDGADCRAKVENRRLNGGAPKALIVSVYRKGYTFKVINKAREFGLRVADVWQYDDDQENERVRFKLEVDE